MRQDKLPSILKPKTMQSPVNINHTDQGRPSMVKYVKTEANYQPRQQTSRPSVVNRNDKGEMRCFNCNVFGHISKDCPEPRKPLSCQNCRRDGHTKANSTSGTSSNREDNVQFVKENISKGEDIIKYLKNAVINNIFQCGA